MKSNFSRISLLVLGCFLAVLAGQAWAQETPIPTTSTGTTEPQTTQDQSSQAVPQKKLSTNEKLKALEEKNMDLEMRLKTLENRQAAAMNSTATPIASPVVAPDTQSQVGPPMEGTAVGAGLGVHDVALPYEAGDEYMYSESRYLSFSNRAGDTEFRLGGYEWTDLDINNQTATVSSNGVTTYNYLNNPSNNNNGFVARKAHLDFRSTFNKFVGAAIGIESDKSTGVSLGIYHAYAYVKFDKAFNLQFGKISNPLSLEGLQPSADLPFVEASMIANLAVNKDICAMVDGKVNHFMDYALEIANGQQDNESSATGPGKPAGDFKALTGRIFFTPWEKSGDEWLQGLGFGGGGSVDNETLEDTAVWAKLETSIGGNSFMTYSGSVQPAGAFYHVDGQGYYYKNSFGLMAEWIQSIQTVQGSAKVPVQLANTGWLAEAQWVFGGKAGFEGAQVDNPFDPSKGKWGALELVARVDSNIIDVQSFTKGFAYAPTSSLGTGAQIAMAYGVGFNWWLNENFKFMCDGEETEFSGGNAIILPEQIMVVRAALTM